MIGLSGVIGELDKTKNYLSNFSQVHAVEGVNMAVLSYCSNTCAISLITRKEISGNRFNSKRYETDQHVAILEGYVHFDESLHSGEAEFILDKWSVGTPESLGELNGEFVAVIYNKQNHSLIIFNDRLGSRPFYYFNSGKTVHFGSEKKAIFSSSSHQPSLSGSGLIEFFALSHNLQQKTLYENVQALPPATIISINGGHIEETRYWRLAFTNSLKFAPTSDFIMEGVELLKNGAEWRYRGLKKLGLGLSGGLDSRVVAATIPADIRPVFARTYGHEGSLEVQVAKQLAQRLNFDHYIHQPTDIQFSAFLYPSVWRTEGSVHFTGLKSIVEHHTIIDRAWYNLSGHFGDVLTGKQLRPFMYLPMSTEKFIQRVFDHYVSYTYRSVDAFQSLFNPLFFKVNFPEMRNRFIASLLEIEAENHRDLYDAWDLTNRQPRFTFCSSAVDNYLCEKIVIFTDRAYVDHMLGVADRYRFGQTLYKRMILEGFPKLADIPSSNSAKTLKRSISGNLFDLAFQYRRQQYDKKRTLSSGSGSKSDLIRNDQKLRELLDQFTNSDGFPSQFLSAKGIRSAIDDHYSGRRDWTYFIGVYATMVAAHHLFIQNKHTRPPDFVQPLDIQK